MSPPDAAGANGGDFPHVAVLLLNWNGWRDTVECLESVFRMKYPRMTVVVCDNGSADDSIERIREWATGASIPELSTPTALRHLVEPRVSKPIALREYSRTEAETGGHPLPMGQFVLIHNGANLGFAGGNNVGLRLLTTQAQVKYVWLLNNDTVVAPDSLSELVRCAEGSHNIGGVGGTLYEYADPGEIESTAGGLFPPWKGLSIPLKRIQYKTTPRGETVPVIDYLTAGCLLASVAMIAQVGLIDEDYFMYAEDVDYSFRIRRAGFALAYAPKAKVWHKGGGTTGHRSARHDYYIVRNSLHLVRKYYPTMLPIATLYIAYQCALPKVVRRQWGRLAVVGRAYRDFQRGTFGAPKALPGEVLRPTS